MSCISSKLELFEAIRIVNTDAQTARRRLLAGRATQAPAEVAGVGAIVVAVVTTSGQFQQGIGKVELLGRWFTAGEVQRQILGLQIGIIPPLKLILCQQFVTT